MRKKRRFRRILLALDPGTAQSAWVLWNGWRILDFGLEPNEVVLKRFEEGFPATHFTYEMFASFGMAAGKSIFETCVWIGQFRHAWGTKNPVDKLYRKTIAAKLVSPRARDSQIRAAVIALVGPPGKKKFQGPTYGFRKDLWQALAVAIVGYKKLLETP